MLEFIPKRPLYIILACFLALMIVGIVLIFLLPPSSVASTNTTTTTTTIATPHCNGQWNVMTDALAAANPNANTAAYLSDVVTLAPKDAWAVGSSTDMTTTTTVQEPLVEHWDGQVWKQIHIANAANKNGVFKAIAALSANDIWAVGDVQNFINSPLVEHWDGKQWSVIATPAPPTGDAANTLLTGVAALSTNDVWIVGSYSTYTSGPQAPTVGGAADNATSSDQGGASAGATNQADATYKTLIEHWDGQTWSIVDSPDAGQTTNTLQAVTAISSNDVWAVGTQDNMPLTIHWDGNTWQTVPNATLPRTPSKSGLNAIVRVPGTPYLWAVGSFQEAVSLSAGQEYQTLVEYWDGQQWQFVPNIASAQQGDTLNALVAIAANDVWAVGQDHNSQLLTEHWNGKRWQMISIPNTDQAQMGSLSAISASNGRNVWAVGKFSTGTGVNALNQSLIEEYC
jgi:hypothetical protein